MPNGLAAKFDKVRCKSKSFEQVMDQIKIKKRKRRRSLKQLLPFWLPILLIFTISSGCASDTYRYGLDQSSFSNNPISIESRSNVLIGGPKPRVDRFESIVQAPRRLVGKLLGKPMVDPETAMEQRHQATLIADRYFAANGIENVNIDIRVYDPKLQWHRLIQNDQIAPVWKYTGGTIGWLRYTLLPMRAFHTDRYDPYTNTLHLNSTRPLRALYEAASAKEYQRKRSLGPIDVGTGNYAMLQFVPFAPLVHSANASSDVLTYAQFNLPPDAQSDLYPLVYSKMGSTAVSEVLSVVTLSPDTPFYTSPLLRVGGSIAGRATGKAVLFYSMDMSDDGFETKDVGQPRPGPGNSDYENSFLPGSYFQ